MNLFQTVKATVSVADAARKYGIEANRHGMAKCPFHDDHHPSLKLNDHYYYCFGCGARGDVIDLVIRLFGLSPYEAAKKLAEDFRIDPDKPPSGAALAKPIPRMVKAIRGDEDYCHRVVCDYLHLLEDWKVQYAPASMDEELDDRFVEACQMLDHIKYLADILTDGEPGARKETVKKLMKDGDIARLEEKVKRNKRAEKGGMIYGEEERLAG